MTRHQGQGGSARISGAPTRAAQILRRIDSDDDSAAEELLPLVYDELHRLAVGYMGRERRDHTLQPTALVSEAFLKLVGSDGGFESRGHFVGVAARAMRQVLVDHARRRQADKRGGEWLRVTLDRSDPRAVVSCHEIVALHEAIDRLGEKNQRMARVVELRSFGGLTIREAAETLGVSHTTVEDDWSFAKAWLARELAGDT